MQTTLTIRPGLPGERDELIALMRRASLANPGDREALLAHPEAIDVPAEQLRADATCVAELDGSLAGFAVVLPRPDGEAELDGLFVEPHLWRAGVGRALISRAKALASLLGASYLHVISNPHADQFYRATGFEEVGPFETQFGPGLMMRLAVSS